MNGQINKYNSYMQQTYSPVDVNSLPYFVDMKAMRDYAKEKGVSIASLSDSEKEKFIKTNSLKNCASNFQLTRIFDS